MTSVDIAFLASCIAFCFATYFYFFPNRGNGDISLESTNLFETTPALQLVPRIDSLMDPNHKLIVTSSSGGYPESLIGGSLWMEKIEEWLRRGVAIEYLITSGKPKHCHAISELGLMFPDLLNITFLVNDDTKSERLIKIINDYHDTHPTFVVDSENTPVALWLERFHSPESGMALDVSYVSPMDISESELAYIHWSQLSELRNASEVLSQPEMRRVCSAAAQAA